MKVIKGLLIIGITVYIFIFILNRFFNGKEQSKSEANSSTPRTDISKDLEPLKEDKSTDLKVLSEISRSTYLIVQAIILFIVPIFFTLSTKVGSKFEAIDFFILHLDLLDALFLASIEKLLRMQFETMIYLYISLKIIIKLSIIIYMGNNIGEIKKLFINLSIFLNIIFVVSSTLYNLIMNAVSLA